MWVSASEIGRAASCPHYLELKERGCNVSSVAMHARKQGDMAHEAFNRAISDDDKRCFIATYQYGDDDPRTRALRLFRDLYLSNTFGGSLLISVYYRLSPLWIQLCQQSVIAKKLTRRLLDSVTVYVQCHLANSPAIAPKAMSHDDNKGVE